MKKVLLVATVQSHIAQFHIPLIKMLKEKNYEVHVAAKDNLEEKNGLKIEYADKIFDVCFARSPFKLNNLKAYKQLKKIVKENNYDVVHCNTPMGSVIARLVCKKYRKKGLKVIYTAHGFHFFKGAPIKNWLIYYPIEKYLSKYTDILITINTEDFELSKSKFKANDTVLVNGVGISKKKFEDSNLNKEEIAKLKKINNIKENDFVFISIGELNSNKNQILQIEAMKEICKENKNIKLLIAGNGPLKDFYTYKIEEYGLKDNIYLLGYRLDIEKLLKISNCLLATSIREGLGINLIEALYSGVPVISTLNRGHKEIVINNINGFILKENNVENLKGKMLEIYKNTNELNKMQKNIKKTVEKFESNVVLAKMKEIYSKFN